MYDVIEFYQVFETCNTLGNRRRRGLPFHKGRRTVPEPVEFTGCGLTMEHHDEIVDAVVPAFKSRLIGSFGIQTTVPGMTVLSPHLGQHLEFGDLTVSADFGIVV